MVTSTRTVGTARAETNPLPWFGLGLCGVTAIVVATQAPVPLRVPLVLAFACLGPGMAVLAHGRRPDPATGAALTVLTSLAVFVAASLIPAWSHRWAPTPVVAWLAWACAASCLAAAARPVVSEPLARIRSARFTVPRRGRPIVLHTDVPRLNRPRVAVPAQRTTSPDALPPAAASWRSYLLPALLLVVALVTWIVALALTDVTRVGRYGLLGVVSPVFFAAPVACLVGVVLELARSQARWPVLVGYLLLLILFLHATTPILLAEPQYAWAYRYIGVIDHIGGHGRLAAGDILQQWPGFVAAAAQLAGATGASGAQLAPWAPLLFNLVGSVLLFAVAFALRPDRRVAFGTVLVFQCVNWVDEDYLSAQGLGFVLGLGVVYVVVRFLRADPSSRHPWLQFLHSGLYPSVPVTGRVRYAAVGGVALLMVLLSATHQVSSYLTAVNLVALVALGLVRPWWVAPVAAAVPVLYLVPRLHFASEWFAGMNLVRAVGAGADSWGTASLSAIAVRGLAASVWVAVILAVYADRRRPGRLLVPLVLALVPCGLIAWANYGGSAIYRVYLFSVPWCAFIIAVYGDSLRWPRWRKTATAAAALVLAFFATIQGRTGQLLVDHHGPDEVAAARYLVAHAAPGATIVLATPNFPSLQKAGPDLVSGAGLRNVTLSPDYLPAIDRYAASFGAAAVYLVVSREMANEARFYGSLPLGALDNLVSTLDSAARWTPFFRNSDVTIYRYEH
jgi:hypothetical protein